MGNEKEKEEWGRRLTWAVTELLVLSFLLYLMTLLPKIFPLHRIFHVVYYIIMISLCVIVLAAVYKVVNRFFSKQNKSKA